MINQQILQNAMMETQFIDQNMLSLLNDETLILMAHDFYFSQRIVSQFEVLQHISFPDEFYNVVWKRNYTMIKYMNNPTEEQKIASVWRNPTMIYYIRNNVSNAVVKKALNQWNSHHLFVRLYKDHPLVPRLLKNADVHLLIKSISNIGSVGEKIVISRLKNNELRQSEHSKVIVVWPKFVPHIPDLTQETIESSLSKNYNLIHYIDNPTIKHYKTLIKISATLIRLCKNPSDELCRIAIKKDCLAIYYIENPSEEIIQLAKNHKHGHRLKMKRYSHDSLYERLK